MCSSLKMDRRWQRRKRRRSGASILYRTHLLVLSRSEPVEVGFSPRCPSSVALRSCAEAKKKLHPQLSVSPPPPSPSPPPLIRNSFTSLARRLSARDVVPMGHERVCPAVSRRAARDSLWRIPPRPRRSSVGFRCHRDAAWGFILPENIHIHSSF